MKKIYYELILISLVAIWGLSFSLTKPLLSKMGVFNFIAYRFVIATVVLFFILKSLKRFKLNKISLKKGIIAGSLMFIAMYCHIVGLKYTTIANNAFIVGSSIIFIPFILRIYYKEKSNLMTIIQTAMSIVGLGLITLIGTTKGLHFGDLITMLGTVLYSFYTIYIEKNVKKINPGVFTTIQLGTVGLLSLISTVLFETFEYRFDAHEWTNILFLSIVITGLAYFVLMYIQRYLSASNVTLIFTFEPFFATVFGWLFLKEMITSNIIVGGFIIILSVVLPYLIKEKSFQIEVRDMNLEKNLVMIKYIYNEATNIERELHPLEMVCALLNNKYELNLKAVVEDKNNGRIIIRQQDYVHLEKISTITQELLLAEVAI